MKTTGTLPYMRNRISIEIFDLTKGEYKYPNQKTVEINISIADDVPTILNDFMEGFEVNEADEALATTAQGLFGYTTYDAVRLVEEQITPYITKRKAK